MAADFFLYSFEGVGEEYFFRQDCCTSGTSSTQSEGGATISYYLPLEAAGEASYRGDGFESSLGSRTVSRISIAAGTITVEDRSLEGNVFSLTGFGDSFGDFLPSAEGVYQLTGSFLLSNNQPRLYYQQSASGTIKRLSISKVSGSFGGGFQGVTVVPEPVTWAMMLVGFGMMAYSLRQRSRVSYAT
jgi:hypothetical protein